MGQTDLSDILIPVGISAGVSLLISLVGCMRGRNVQRENEERFSYFQSQITALKSLMTPPPTAPGIPMYGGATAPYGSYYPVMSVTI